MLTQLNNTHIVFVGGGNMARALIDGLLKAKKAQNLSFEITVSDPNQDNLDYFASLGVATTLPAGAKQHVQTADIVVLAVKPQMMTEVCASFGETLAKPLIISIAAGLSLDSLAQMTGSERIVRVMPNLPATVGLGASGLYSRLDESSKALAEAVLSASGVALWVGKEEDLHTVTAIAGSAPAYFFYLLRHMIDKAVALGLDETSAKRLAVQTMQGAAVMAQAGDPATLQSQVTSKGGTTHAAISHFERVQMDVIIKDAMQACYDRSVELGS